MTESPKTITFANDKERDAFYGVTGAAIRGWKKKGEHAGDPFPVNDPIAVVEWYRRHYAKSAPQSLLLAAANFGKPATKKKGKSKAQELDGLDIGGLTESLERARKIEAYYGNLLEEALRTKNKEDAELYRGPYLKAQAGLRDTEKAAVDVAKKRKQLIERNAVVAAWSNMHGHLPRALARAFREAKPEEIASEAWGLMVRKATDKAMELLPAILPEILAEASADEQETKSEIPT